YRRWVVWGPDNLLYIPKIKREIPDALFIHVVRDGRDVALALNRKRFIRPFPWDRNYGLLVSALHWKWKVQTGRRYAPSLGTDYLEVHFEDLVLKPSETLETVGKFIAQPLDYEEIRKAEVGVIRSPNTSFTEELDRGNFSPVGRWKSMLTEDEVTRLESIVGDVLVELGYPLAGSRPVSHESRVRAMQYVYPGFYSLKEWLKTSTPMGRFVNTNRLHLNEVEDAGLNPPGLLKTYGTQRG